MINFLVLFFFQVDCFFNQYHFNSPPTYTHADGTSVLSLADDSFVFTVTSDDNSFVSKVNFTGNVNWATEYNSITTLRGNAPICLMGNDIININGMTGFSQVIKMSSSLGNKIWANRFSTLGKFETSLCDSDENVLISNTGSLFQLDSSGDLQWGKTFAIENQTLVSISELSGGGYVGMNEDGSVIVKIDSSGNIIDEKEIIGLNGVFLKEIFESTGGSFLATGYNSGDDVILLRIAADLSTVQWGNSYTLPTASRGLTVGEGNEDPIVLGSVNPNNQIPSVLTLQTNGNLIAGKTLSGINFKSLNFPSFYKNYEVDGVVFLGAVGDNATVTRYSDPLGCDADGYTWNPVAITVNALAGITIGPTSLLWDPFVPTSTISTTSFDPVEVTVTESCPYTGCFCRLPEDCSEKPLECASCNWWMHGTTCDQYSQCKDCNKDHPADCDYNKDGCQGCGFYWKQNLCNKCPSNYEVINGRCRVQNYVGMAVGFSILGAFLAYCFCCIICCSVCVNVLNCVIKIAKVAAD